MIADIQSKLAEISQSYDARIHHCDLTATMADNTHCRLSGRVLDGSVLTSVTDALVNTFTGFTFETSDVQVLRPGQQVTVCTSVTGLYCGPSFGKEMVSQLLNGWQVEMLIEREGWAFVRQPDGYLGWTYRSYLDQDRPPKPTHLAHEPISQLRAGPAFEDLLTGRIPGGTAVMVEQHEGKWSQIVLAGGEQGWVPTSDLRPLAELPKDPFGRRQQIVVDAAPFVGVPYFWGGITAYGFDCSGYVQLLHRLVGVTIPRDADMQFAAGKPVMPPFQPGDLLFFGNKGGHRSITHVGMSLGGWHIIHSSRARNGVDFDDVKAVSWLNDIFVGACTFLE